MASTSRQAASSSVPSCSSLPRWIHDVFLSFRGDDTRNSFTAHLYAALRRKGINAYMDDRDLVRGKTIEPTLWKAIEESRFSIVIFSRDYASSPWCPDELDKIVQCMTKMKHTVLPVFYHVDPSEVAGQTGNYERAFVKHEEDFRETMEKLQSWRNSLNKVANASGWDVQGRNELELVEEIADEIWKQMNPTLPFVNDANLVGVDSRATMVMDGYLGKGLNDVRIVGICGMGGIGKTTIAKVVYDRVRREFEGSCFLLNVRDFCEKHELYHLQVRLLSQILNEKDIEIGDVEDGKKQIKNRLQHMKVLLVLDDVERKEQLKYLAGQLDWFGPGSRIIITTREKHLLLVANKVNDIYEVEELNGDESLMLFSWNAFNKEQPEEEYLELSKRVVDYTAGLPLALEVLGSSLKCTSKKAFENAINALNDNPSNDILDVLQVSFDPLDEFLKKIFLDIACFFNGMDRDRVTGILNSCGFHATYGIEVLINKSLISDSGNGLWMHDLLQVMGRQIVRRKSLDDVGGYSRLWAYKDVSHVLKNNIGENIESILLNLPKMKEKKWNLKAFSKMSKVRLLKIHNVSFAQGPDYLSKELRLLEWHAYPSESLPSSFKASKLVELNMSNSSIKRLWHENKKSLDNLTIINLSDCQNLTETPDFSRIPNLERLILEGCTNLCEVHPSIGHHKKLMHVNLVDCRSLTKLPRTLEMESLEVLTLRGCSKLLQFPDIKVGSVKCLKMLYLDETSIEELPSSIENLAGLEILSLNNCESLQSLPSSISCLESLTKLDISGCYRLLSMPESLGQIERLNELDLSGTAIRQPPLSIFLLKNLEVLYFDGSKRLGVNSMDLVLPTLSGLCSLQVLSLSGCNLREGGVPDLGCLFSLRSLDLSRNNFVSLPPSINELFRLEILSLEDCQMLKSLPEVPPNIQEVNLNNCNSLRQIADPLGLHSSEKLEFKCLNCWALSNSHDNSGFTLLTNYLQGLFYPRKFGVAIPGNEIPTWFSCRSDGPSVSVLVDSKEREWMGIVACVAFNSSSLETYESCSLSCHFKTNGGKNHPSPMCISWDFILLSDHLWLFYLPLPYFKDWQNECLGKIELLFHPHCKKVKVKKCGVHPVHWRQNECLGKIELLFHPHCKKVKVKKCGVHPVRWMSNNNNNKDDNEKDMVMPGFGFRPAEEELVGFYLHRTVQGKHFNVELISFLDLYHYDPWELPALAATGEKEWFFYVRREWKYRFCNRLNLATTSGYWKVTGVDRMIRTINSRSIGLKKTLVFYSGKAPKGIRTCWIMFEYRLPQHEAEQYQKAEIFLCRVCKRAGVADHSSLPRLLPSRASSLRGPQSEKQQQPHLGMERFQSFGGQPQHIEMEKMSETDGICSSSDVATPLGLSKHNNIYHPLPPISTSLGLPASVEEGMFPNQSKQACSLVPNCTNLFAGSSSVSSIPVDDLHRLVNYQQAYINQQQQQQFYSMPPQSQPLPLNMRPSLLPTAFSDSLWGGIKCLNPVETTTIHSSNQ